MAAGDKIIVSAQNRLEQAGLDALRPFMRPWRCTLVDQRDDFGRDGIVQIVDEDLDGATSISPLTFWIQCKATESTFSDKYGFVVETRHLAVWSDPGAAPLMLVAWSAATGDFRFRSARHIREELDRLNSGWRNQESVTVHLNKEHAFESSAAARASLRRQVGDENDQQGGIVRFHEARRRLVVTTLFKGTVTTSQTLEISGPKDLTLRVGEAWIQQDLDPYEVRAERVLAAGLLLFEEMWIPMNSTRVVGQIVGYDLLLELLSSRRIRLLDLGSSFGLLSDKGATVGEVLTFITQKSRQESLRLILQGDVAEAVERELASHIVTIPDLKASDILEQVRRDLKQTGIRSLLGLRPLVSDVEPVWDAGLVNRIVSANCARAVGFHVRADVVQYEGGLSRLISEKEYGLLGLSRNFGSSSAFDAVVRSAGVPDLGQLLQRMSVREVIALSNTDSAQDFRDWFWASASEIVCSGGIVARDVLSRLERVVGDDLRAFRFPVTLKMRYLDAIGAAYVIGETARPRPAFSATAASGDEVILRQRRNYRRTREIELLKFGKLPSPYEKCRCGSEEKYRFCCGRKD
jgi:Domain of unknown function (DUF4365)